MSQERKSPSINFSSNQGFQISQTLQTNAMANNQNRASWSSSTTRLFLQLLIEEKNAGNWCGKSATKKGYENVGNMIRQHTGTEFNKAQMKSKFDGLKSLFRLWANMFNGQTDEGYKHAIGNITMPEPWWEDKIKENYTYKKFKKGGLDNAELMYTVFGENNATGVYQYTPTSNPNTDFNSQHDETSDGAMLHTATPWLDKDVTSLPPTGEGNELSRGKRKLHSEDSWITIVNSLKNAFVDACGSKEFVCKHVQVDHDGEKTQKAIDLLYAIPNLSSESNLFFLGLKLLGDKDKRDVFLAIRSDAARLRWLQMYEE